MRRGRDTTDGDEVEERPAKKQANDLSSFFRRWLRLRKAPWISQVLLWAHWGSLLQQALCLRSHFVPFKTACWWWRWRRGLFIEIVRLLSRTKIWGPLSFALESLLFPFTNFFYFLLLNIRSRPIPGGFISVEVLIFDPPPVDSLIVKATAFLPPSGMECILGKLSCNCSIPRAGACL